MFIFLSLVLTGIFYFMFSIMRKNNKIFKKLFLSFLSLSLLLSGLSCCQQAYISNYFMNVSSLVTFDENNYPSNHFVNLYINTESQRIYTIDSFYGIYFFKEVSLAEDVEPIIVDNKNLPPYNNNKPLFTYSDEEA